MTEPRRFEFDFDPATFKVGDTVRYRVPSFGDFPFAASVKTTVHEDDIEIEDADEPGRLMRATRAGRPLVSDTAALS